MAARLAGLVVADAGDHDVLPPVRGTAGIRDLENQPIPRDAYAEYLQERMDAAGEAAVGDSATNDDVRLSEHKAEAVAALLDEFAAIYGREAVGQLARRLATAIYDQLTPPGSEIQQEDG